jgi:hypothetical protein
MRAARHSIWARAKDRSGLERPHLWGLSAAQRLRGVAPARCFEEESANSVFYPRQEKSSLRQITSNAMGGMKCRSSISNPQS